MLFIKMVDVLFKILMIPFLLVAIPFYLCYDWFKDKRSDRQYVRLLKHAQTLRLKGFTMDMTDHAFNKRLEAFKKELLAIKAPDRS